MPESFKMKINLPSREGMPTRKPFKKRTTLEEVITWINGQNYDDYAKTELIKMLKKYPYTLYENFRQNINVHLGKVNAKKRATQFTPKDEHEKGIEERVEKGDSFPKEGDADFTEGN
jgi:hypothetical protein